jgi:cytochrome o ubiquinol oxidase operon protein cyoD
MLSLILTLAAFIPVFIHTNTSHMSFPHELLIPYLIVLALIQLVIQLVFFLHFGREEKPYFNALFLFYITGMILIVVIGSIWIMTHLNYNMTSAGMEKHLINDEGIHH